MLVVEERSLQECAEASPFSGCEAGHEPCRPVLDIDLAVSGRFLRGCGHGGFAAVPAFIATPKALRPPRRQVRQEFLQTLHGSIERAEHLSGLLLEITKEILDGILDELLGIGRAVPPMAGDIGVQPRHEQLGQPIPRLAVPGDIAPPTRPPSILRDDSSWVASSCKPEASASGPPATCPPEFRHDCVRRIERSRARRVAAAKPWCGRADDRVPMTLARLLPGRSAIQAPWRRPPKMRCRAAEGGVQCNAFVPLDRLRVEQAGVVSVQRSGRWRPIKGGGQRCACQYHQ